MATFRYSGLLPNGKKRNGFINAIDITEAKHKLSLGGFLLTKIQEESDKKNSFFSKEEVLLFTKELSKLLQAGLPLFDALVALEEKYQGHKFQPILSDLCASVKQGLSFSAALKKYSCFDPLYISLIENAEKIGSLSSSLDELSNLTARNLAIKKQLMNALLYPLLLSLFCLVVLGTLIFYILPSLSELFEGRKLHSFTAFILGVSNFANQHKFTLFCLFISGVSFFVVAFLSQKGKNLLSGLALRMPFLGDVLSKAALVRFCRSSGALLSSSLPLLETLRLSKKVVRHPGLEKVLEEAEKKLLTGGKVSSTLQTSPLIPSLFVRMFALAEISGNLPLMMQHLAQIYEDDLEKRCTKLTQLAQPLLLLFLGGIIGLVLLSVLLPLTDVGSFLENQ